LQSSLLDQPIQHRGDAQLALASIRLGDHHPSYRTWPVRACQQLLANVGPVIAYCLGSLLDVEPVYPGSKRAGNTP
jgi:hypothetical protein